MDQTAKDILSGRAKGIGPTLVRSVTAMIEPIYVAVMRTRNLAYDRGWKHSHHAPLPVISVGNLTTGGTGKTPVVQWLASRLIEAGIRPAVLMRGYKAQLGQMGDEQQLLTDSLAAYSVLVLANADRVAGAAEIARQDPAARVILLDDGFQHRRLHRDFDLVLIDATGPFGFDHVLPRGLLREPIAGVRRANAVLLTRCDAAQREQLAWIENVIRAQAAETPIFRSSHHLSIPPAVHGRRVFAFCGIGNPAAFFADLQIAGMTLVGKRAFDDHHAYSAADISVLNSLARDASAEMFLTTEKDWVKVRELSPASLPTHPMPLELRFEGSDEDRLLKCLLDRVRR